MKRLSSIILTITFILILNSCNKNENIPGKENIPVKENTSKNVYKIRSDYHKEFLKKIRLKTNRIEICSYKLSGNTMSDTTSVLKRKNLVNSEKLKAFNTLFDTLKVGGYCCCPKTHYTMKLFDKSKMLKRYNVDTIEVKDKVLIFDTSYQTSYIITLKDWRNLIE